MTLSLVSVRCLLAKGPRNLVTHMQLWTLSCDYYATGEGRTLCGWIGYAEDERDALKSFAQEFGDYFASGAVVSRGVVDNDVIRELFSPAVLARMRALENRATAMLTARYHFNLA